MTLIHNSLFDTFSFSLSSLFQTFGMMKWGMNENTRERETKEQKKSNENKDIKKKREDPERRENTEEWFERMKRNENCILITCTEHTHKMNRNRKREEKKKRTRGKKIDGSSG